MSDPVAKPAFARRCAGWIYRQAVRFFALFGLLSMTYLMCLDCSRITSESMKPTLQGTDWQGGDRVLTEKVTYRFRRPRRWEVITFRAVDGRTIMKRVVGLPGEKLRMLRGGQILVDGGQTAPPPELAFLDYFPYGNLTGDKPPAECGNGYFVLGDDSRDSDDSRFNGPVPADRLIGRAWLIVGPDGRRGFVNP